jgi:hypothetical protein
MSIIASLSKSATPSPSDKPSQHPSQSVKEALQLLSLRGCVLKGMPQLMDKAFVRLFGYQFPDLTPKIRSAL